MQDVGIEQARKALGEIANRAALAGEVTYLTRNGRRIAAIAPLDRVRDRDDDTRDDAPIQEDQ